MLFFTLLVLILVLAFWLLWRLYVSRFHSQRPAARACHPDEWTEVLESIKALPETQDSSRGVANRRRPRRSGA